MTRILAIDPGSEYSAWLLLVDGRPERFAKEPNATVRDMLRWDIDTQADVAITRVDLVVIEWMSPRGMPTSQQEMEAMFWAGRYAEAARPLPVERLTRDVVKLHLTGKRAKVNDANVRAALIDRYGGIGGPDVAIGRKATPGPLYGIAADVWAALAVAVTYLDDPKLVVA